VEDEVVPLRHSFPGDNQHDASLPDIYGRNDIKLES